MTITLTQAMIDDGVQRREDAKVRLRHARDTEEFWLIWKAVSGIFVDAPDRHAVLSEFPEYYPKGVTECRNETRRQ